MANRVMFSIEASESDPEVSRMRQCPSCVAVTKRHCSPEQSGGRRSTRFWRRCISLGRCLNPRVAWNRCGGCYPGNSSRLLCRNAQ